MRRCGVVRAFGGDRLELNLLFSEMELGLVLEKAVSDDVDVEQIAERSG